ncbi:hypothetical protein C8A01DRAFT_41698 [Parachaetomium inaequale]|uniref:Uncharacterized protein n=1 Tax=Parachaetomium inaequale TaxID=2588326 RepID=A0AAN6SLM2_9PEZI|nr:hypothetical protein C8A01DRAFT_41698 [Parachaetomium inaequale]
MAWGVVREQYRVEVLGLPPAVRAPPPENLPRVLATYFSRRWFRRLWPLQEVMLPELSRVEFMCGEKTTTGERMLYLSTLLRQDQASKGWDVERISRLARPRSPQKTPTQSCLLDLLIETQDRQCEDPRDKIFAILAIARRLDGAAFTRRDSDISVDYRKSVAEVYTSYSAQFIRRHGPGFFLALIKSRPKVEGLPSWAADWTVPWPDERALAEMGPVSRYRAADEKDEVLDIETDTSGRMLMKIMRPRVVRGFFTRNGHVDGAARTQIESVRQLRRDEALVEMYPGLALLLRQEKGQPEHYAFVRVCPHALSREGVENAVASWSRVVVHKENVGQGHDGPPPKGYLSLPGVYKIV